MADISVRVGDRFELWTRQLLWVLRDGEWHDLSTIVARSGTVIPATQAMREVEQRRQIAGSGKPRQRPLSQSAQVASGRRAIIYSTCVSMVGVERRKLGTGHHGTLQFRDTRFDWPIKVAGELRSAHCGFGPANHKPCTYRFCGCVCHELAGVSARGMGLWETGPPDDERCACCNKRLSLSGVQPQFLGLSNGHCLWCCNLSCLIDEAMKERAAYTDGVGPQGPNEF